jgi:hypothetical protein
MTTVHAHARRGTRGVRSHVRSRYPSAPHGISLPAFKRDFERALRERSGEGGGFLLWLKNGEMEYTTGYDVEPDGKSVRLKTYSTYGERTYPGEKFIRRPPVKLSDIRGF